MSETHLKGNESLSIERCTSYVNNRCETHKKTPKGSGGVAVLVKDALLNVYKAEIADNQEGILDVSFMNKFTESLARTLHFSTPWFA